MKTNIYFKELDKQGNPSLRIFESEDVLTQPEALALIQEQGLKVVENRLMVTYEGE